MQGMQHSALWDDDVYDYVDDTRTSGVDVLGKKYDRWEKEQLSWEKDEHKS